MMVKNIGIFGGSFDPPHLGHRALAFSFLGSGTIDELWVLLTPVPPHKTDRELTSYKLRLQMAEANFRNIQGCRVSDFEYSMEPPHYTIRTLEKLKQNYPDDRFLLCMGQDSLNNIKTWYRGDELLATYPFLVAKRPGEEEHFIGENITYVTHDPVDISATSVRDSIAVNTKNWQSLVDPEVEKIINRHALYQ